MSDLLVGTLSVLLATNAPAALSNLVARKTGRPLPSPARLEEATDPVGAELRRVMDLDDATGRDLQDLVARNQGADPNHPATLSPTALDRAVEERVGKVRAAYEELIRRHPRHAPTRVAFASFLEEHGEEPEVIGQLETATTLDPDSAAAWNNLANHYGHVGPVAKAFPAYERAISLNPREPVYGYNLATTVFLFRKDAAEYYRCDEQAVFARALDLYRKVRALRPFDFRYAYDFAQTYYGVKPAPAEDAAGRRASELRLAEDALAAWQEAWALADNELDRQGVSLHQARWQLKAGRWEAARTNLAAVTDPQHAEVRKRLEQSLARATSSAPR
ncbi:MAG: hypothetical protein ACKOET_16480 [Verrucomicrobiota bacterium]